MAVVHVVDDEPKLRSAISRLLRSLDMKVEVYDSARDFLDRFPETGVGCVVLDLSMPEMSGLELQSVLMERGRHLPVVFITGNGSIPATVQAMKAGAVDFLTKPFEDKDLILAIQTALKRSAEVIAAGGILESDWSNFKSLTVRQRQVCLLVVRGLLNKQIAGDLGLAEGTVKLHRSCVMRKMRVDSVAELVKLIQRLEDAGRI